MERFSRFSYLWEGLLIVAALVFAYVRRPSDILLLVLFGVVGLLLIAGFVFRRSNIAVNPEKRVRKSIGGGKAVLLDFFSNFSTSALLTTTVLTRLERRYRGRVDVISVNMNTRAGRAIARQHRAACGNFVLFDARGQELTRSAWVSRRLLAPVLESQRS